MSINFDLTSDLTDTEKRILSKVSSRNNESPAQILRRIALRDLVRNEANQAMVKMIDAGTIPDAIVSAIETGA